MRCREICISPTSVVPRWWIAACDYYWKAVELCLPDTLPAADVLVHARAQIRIIAAEAGEFVEDIRIGLATSRGDGWKRWDVSYLPGRPALDLVTD